MNSRPVRFTTVEAQAAGLQRWHLEGRSWRRVGPATYAWAGLAANRKLDLAAALIRLPDEGMFSGLTALLLHGLDVAADCPIEATVPARAGVSARAGITLRRQAESPQETRLRLALVLRGLPRPEAQKVLRDRDGRPPARVDLYYACRQLGLEYDGAVHRDRFVEDRRRLNALTRAGYQFVCFTNADLARPDLVAAQVRGLLGA